MTTLWGEIRNRARSRSQGAVEPTTLATQPPVSVTTSGSGDNTIPRPVNPGVTHSTEEAMDLLGEVRAELIARGREEAISLAEQYGFVHSRMVRLRLEELGLLGDTDIKDFWLGAIFNQNLRFKWSGEVFTYEDRARNIHERTVKVWKLRSPEELAAAEAEVAVKRATKKANRRRPSSQGNP